MKAVIAFERLVALVFACLENLIHGAVIFGWPSLVFVYLQLGYFHDLCSDSSENATSPVILTTTTTAHNLSTVEGLESCPEQESRLQLVFSIAVALQATCMFPVGFLFDRFGTRFSRLVMSILLLVGYVLMALSSPTYPILVFPGTICFTIGGVIMLFSSMQIGNLFGGQKSTVITIINSMYGAAVIMLVVAKRVHDSGFSINIFFFIMAASVIPLNINTFLLLPTKYIPWPLPEGYKLVNLCTPRTTSGAKDEQESASYNRGYVGDLDSDMTGVDGHYRQKGVESITRDLDREAVVSRIETSKDISEYGISEVEERKNKEYGSLGACILSTPFFMLLLWQAFLEIDLTFTIGTLTFFLTRLSDADEDLVSWYTDIFSITRFFVLIVGPLGGLLMDRNKLSTSCSLTKQPQKRGPYADVRDSCLPLAITTFASIGYTICLLIPSLQLQYLSFILILIVGSLLFGVGSAVVAVV
ncbi:solute carrier family 43 member 3-like [Strongylocentrotus purpuratus]|uniref:Solute carrier family 43 member 3 n=1 Tax=Strongylocentrotus purpuratus TaxID=7668 RepID=A0A7M7HF47_STRPU|nr:solute carrier family 43 member 3-like [Strongylocentrotus purpuratus]